MTTSAETVHHGGCPRKTQRTKDSQVKVLSALQDLHTFQSIKCVESAVRAK